MAITAASLEEKFDAKYAALNTEYANSPHRTAVKEGLLRALAQAAVEEIQENGEITVPNGTTGSDTLKGTIA